ncbi:MAG: ATP-binding cassette domain-containing protein, partial [Cardiobacteriaceae bacterium]|nr:ATP-binding cassette domain-containing protein [Cardiobacteriaceae bacterium]
AGKSTLVKIITGLFAPDSGEIVLKGERITRFHPAALHKAGVYLVPQEAQILPNQSVFANLVLGLREPHAYLRRVIGELMRSLNIHLDLQAPGATLEIAARQLVEIMRGLLRHSQVLIFDEPTSALTPKETQTLFAQIESLKQAGVAIVFISHKLPEIRDICEDISILRDGEIVLSGAVSDFSDTDLMTAMIGQKPALSARDGETHDAPLEAVLHVEALSGEGFRDLSFTLHGGEILALAGMVGAGRTELAETLFGLRAAQSGSAALLGTSLLPLSTAKRIAAGMIYLPEDRQQNGLFLDCPIAWNLSALILPRLGKRFLREEKRLYQELQGELSIKCQSGEQHAGELSGGNQQKVLLGKCLAARPKVLILDEPTRGVDINARHDIYAIIRSIRAQGIAVLLISSDFDEVAELADRVLVMAHGRRQRELARHECDVPTINAAAFA